MNLKQWKGKYKVIAVVLASIYIILFKFNEAVDVVNELSEKMGNIVEWIDHTPVPVRLLDASISYRIVKLDESKAPPSELEQATFAFRDSPTVYFSSSKKIENSSTIQGFDIEVDEDKEYLSKTSVNIIDIEVENIGKKEIRIDRIDLRTTRTSVPESSFQGQWADGVLLSTYTYYFEICNCTKKFKPPIVIDPTVNSLARFTIELLPSRLNVYLEISYIDKDDRRGYLPIYKPTLDIIDGKTVAVVPPKHSSVRKKDIDLQGEYIKAQAFLNNTKEEYITDILNMKDVDLDWMLSRCAHRYHFDHYEVDAAGYITSTQLGTYLPEKNKGKCRALSSLNMALKALEQADK